MATAKDNRKNSWLKVKIKQYEYELILFSYLCARFFFKNILGLSKYFAQNPVFDSSDILSVCVGVLVVLAVCVFLASMFGKLIRKNGADYETPALVLVALFLACPATLPFLFSTNFLSGTQLLYPFAVFALAVFLYAKPIIRWLVPFICVLYFVPGLHSSAFFFAALQSEAVYYVPLLLLLLFLDMDFVREEPKIKKANQGKVTGSAAQSVETIWLFRTSAIVSISCFAYSQSRSSFSLREYFRGFSSELSLDFLICLLLVSPVLITVCALVVKALRHEFPESSAVPFIIVPVILYPLMQPGICRQWIPFVLNSLFIFVFCSIWKNNPSILFALKKLEDFFLSRKLLFVFILLVMASLSNTSGIYASEFLMNIFNRVPY